MRRRILPVRVNNPYKGKRKEYALVKSYQRKGREEQKNEVQDALVAYVREGSQEDAGGGIRGGGEQLPEAVALSPNAIVKLKERWEKGYEDWRMQLLWVHQYAYIWADGVYLGAGLEKEKTVLLCVVGAREDGEKELIGMEPGYREGKESWAEMLWDLRKLLSESSLRRASPLSRALSRTLQ